MRYRFCNKKLLNYATTFLSMCGGMKASQLKRTFTITTSSTAQASQPKRTVSNVSALPEDYRMVSLAVWKDQLARALEGQDSNKIKEVLSMPGLPENAINRVRYAFKRTPLMEVIVPGNKEIVQEFIKEGAELDARDQFNQTALFLAVQRGWYDIVRMLICAGATTDIEDSAHKTPLVLAVERQDMPMITLLVTMGADPAFKQLEMPISTVVKRLIEDAIAQGRKARSAFEEAKNAANREMYQELNCHLPQVLADLSCRYNDDLRQFICEQMQTEEEGKVKSDDEMDALEVTQAYSQQ